MPIPAKISITGYGFVNKINAIYILRRLCTYGLREAKDIVDFLSISSDNYKLCSINESCFENEDTYQFREIEHVNTHTRFLVNDYFIITFLNEETNTPSPVEEDNVQIFTIDDIESLIPIMKKAISKILEYNDAPEVLQTGIAFFNAIKKYNN